MPKRFLYPLTITFILAIVSCNLSSKDELRQPRSLEAAYTVAAQTVAAKLTGVVQTQAAQSIVTSAPVAEIASLTPAPDKATSTPAPIPATQACDQAQFITDVTIPDGTNVAAGAAFTKTWRLKNIGTCTWTTAYTLVYKGGDTLGGPSSIPLAGTVAPGEVVDISIDLSAPASSGDYLGNWGLANASGQQFTSIYVKISVGQTDVKFAVTSVAFAVSGSCGSFHVKTSITANSAGQVTYRWIYSDGGTDTQAHTPIVFDAAGTKSIEFDDTRTTSGWIDIYIDSPNHQQFGRADLSCP